MLTKQEESASGSYKSILKTTTLFASVKVVTIIVSLVKNKAVALILGPAGVGLFGIFTTTLTLITSVCDFGISKSSVRNISAANSKNEDLQEVSKIVGIFYRLLYILSSAGAIATALFAKQLSILSFGNAHYTWSFLLLGIAVFFTSISTGQLSILQGMRRLKYLAKASATGSFLGMLISIPLFYFFKEAGIIPSIISSAFISFALTNYFLRNISFLPIKFERQEFYSNSKDMLKLGVSMMFVSFMVSLSGFILRAYINKEGGVQEVGLFQAGYTIITGYFGMIFTAMSTDYYPRLSAISEDNIAVETEVNHQTTIALILLCPLIVLLLFGMPIFIQLLYSRTFSETSLYVNLAIFGVIFQAVGQAVGMILLAKNRSLVYISFVFIFQLLFLIDNIVMYRIFGLKGLGIAYSVNMLAYMISLQIIIRKLYSIRFSRQSYECLLYLLLFTTLAYIAKDFKSPLIRYSTATVLIISCFAYSIYMMKKVLSIKSIAKVLKSKFKKSK